MCSRVVMMIRWRLRILTLPLLLFLLAGCRVNSPDDELSGRITLWHSWPEEDVLVLEDALAQFQEIHPGARIVPVAFSDDQLLEEFNKSGNDGLGPAMLIGQDSWIGDLAKNGLIRPLTPKEDSLPSYTSRNRALTLNEGQIFGVPLSLAPNALYYNKRLVSEPPRTLNELLLEAAAGKQVAFVPRFEQAYWGIQAFGEGLFDTQNHFTLAESGFTEWLRWLNEAQYAPGVILNVDDDSLVGLFKSGQVAYYVGGPEKQAFMMSGIDEADSFEYGVVPLPDGPNGAAGPLLPAETILLYAFTSAEQARVANALAAFLVNQQQSIRFMRELDKVPANSSLRVDKRIYPIVNGFSEQAKTAVVIPNEIASDPLVIAGNRAYVSVLSGVLSPEEAVCQFGIEVASFQNYSAANISLPEGCELPAE